MYHESLNPATHATGLDTPAFVLRGAKIEISWSLEGGV